MARLDLRFIIWGDGDPGHQFPMTFFRVITSLFHIFIIKVNSLPACASTLDTPPRLSLILPLPFSPSSITTRQLILSTRNGYSVVLDV